MKDQSKIAKAVMVTLVSAGLAGGSLSALAASKDVKCYGVAKAGKNACGTSKHACAGQAKKSNDPSEWVYKSKQACKEAGGVIKASAKKG